MAPVDSIFLERNVEREIIRAPRESRAPRFTDQPEFHVERLRDSLVAVPKRGSSLLDKAVDAYVGALFTLDRTHATLEAHKDRSRADQLKAAAYAVVYGTVVEGWMVGGAIGNLEALEKGGLAQRASKLRGNLMGVRAGFAHGVTHAREILAMPIKTPR